MSEKTARLRDVKDGMYQWSQVERGKLGGQTKIPHIDPTPDSSMIQSLISYHATV